MRSAGEAESCFLITLWTYGGRPIFSHPETAGLFCRTLSDLRRRLGFKLHAFIVLPDRVRMILGTPDGDPRSVQVAVQRLKSRFAREANARGGKPGLVWQDADQRVALMAGEDVVRRAEMLHRYPVITRLARHPADWRWSSFRVWAGVGRAPVPVDLPEITGSPDLKIWTA